MTSNYFNRPTGTIHSLQWVFAIPFYNFTSMCNLSAVYRDESLSQIHPDEILIVHLPGSCKNPLQKIGNLLYRLTVSCKANLSQVPIILGLPTHKQEFCSPSLQPSLRCKTHAFLPPGLRHLDNFIIP